MGMKQTYEQSTSTFALAMSDVLMINVDFTAIGQYEGCNYDVILIIFQMNLELFKQKQTKKLLFVIRDFYADEGHEDREKEMNQQNLLNDLQGLWHKCVQETEHEGKQLMDYFHVEFEFLASKLDFEEEFLAGANQLAQRFKLDADNCLYVKRDEEDNVPCSGLSKYLENTWRAIRENK